MILIVFSWFVILLNLISCFLNFYFFFIFMLNNFLIKWILFVVDGCFYKLDMVIMSDVIVFLFFMLKVIDFNNVSFILLSVFWLSNFYLLLVMFFDFLWNGLYSFF